VILAVPILDTGFVVAKRLKYRKPVYSADKEHFHHRFDRIGFSQRRTVLYLYAWTLALAGLALALRFVPYSDDRGNFDLGWSLVIGAFGLLAVAATIYLVYTLEILKFRRFRERQLRRQATMVGGETPSEDALHDTIEREIESGEFEAVARD
jgi:UDP-GlcNAc:undecaprenyl-phosphate/decaprenyl-phosphate GlcNAc-1-phosphate transferase